MTGRATIVAGTLACALALAGCQQETKAPEAVRPVQSLLLAADHARTMPLRWALSSRATRPISASVCWDV
ncbi:hypothetical protein ABIF55_001892 [Bradyrhizobium diazoefficiens]